MTHVEETEYFILKIESMEGDVTFSVSEAVVSIQDDDGKNSNLKISSFINCSALYSGVSTYVGLYGSGLFNFRSFVNLPTLFAYFLGFDIPTSSIFIENVFYYSCYLLFVICYLLFVICYLLFVICYLLFIICYLLFVMCYLLFVISYFLSVIKVQIHGISRQIISILHR